ncbi:MAG: DUF6288 domain-containing protein [Planctomycetota bacterium]|jgi:hypothetical protein
MKGIKVTALGLALLMCFFCNLPDTFADVLILEDGRAIEGTVVQKTGDSITIKTSSGIVTSFDRDEVVKICSTDDLKKQCEKKLAKLGKSDEMGHLALADWCRKNGLKAERIAVLEKALGINPENGETKRALELLKGEIPKEWKESKTYRTAPEAGKNNGTARPGTGKQNGNKIVVVGRNNNGPRGGKGSPLKPAKAKSVLEKSLAFLASKQSKAGHWPISMSHLNGKVVVASLCGLAFMASGSTPTKGPYAVNVSRAVKFVMENVATKTNRDSQNRNGQNWNQENWRLGFGGVFLAEAYASHKDPNIKAKLQEVVRRLEDNLEPSGGWGHGPGGPNALGYVELEIISNWALATIGMAKQLGCKVDSEKLKRALDYVNKCTSGMGSTAYSTRGNQRGTGCPGRTGGAILAFAMCRYNCAKLDKMAKYLGRTMEQVPEGHASPVLHFVGGGLGAIQVSKGLWDKYVTTLYPKILELANEDGSFRAITNKEGQKDARQGQCYTVGAFALMLAVDMGRLHFLSGKYGGANPAKLAKSDKKDNSG